MLSVCKREWFILTLSIFPLQSESCPSAEPSPTDSPTTTTNWPVTVHFLSVTQIKLTSQIVSFERATTVTLHSGIKNNNWHWQQNLNWKRKHQYLKTCIGKSCIGTEMAAGVTAVHLSSSGFHKFTWNFQTTSLLRLFLSLTNRNAAVMGNAEFLVIIVIIILIGWPVWVSWQHSRCSSESLCIQLQTRPRPPAGRGRSPPSQHAPLHMTSTSPLTRLGGAEGWHHYQHHHHYY